MESFPLSTVLNLLFFVAMWAFVSVALAVVGGWEQLAERYRGRLSAARQSAPMASGSLNRFGFPARYGNCLNVAVGDEGVQLSAIPIFALGAPRLVIPWSDLGSCRSWRVLGREHFAFHPVRADVKITLMGRAARIVREEIERRERLSAAPAARIAAPAAISRL